MDKLQMHISAAITNYSNDCSDSKERGNTLHLGRRRERDPRKVDLTSSTVFIAATEVTAYALSPIDTWNSTTAITHTPPGYNMLSSRTV